MSVLVWFLYGALENLAVLIALRRAGVIRQEKRLELLRKSEGRQPGRKFNVVVRPAKRRKMV